MIPTGRLLLSRLLFELACQCVLVPARAGAAVAGVLARVGRRVSSGR